jgi:hypothetical protein
MMEREGRRVDQNVNDLNREGVECKNAPNSNSAVMSDDPPDRGLFPTVKAQTMTEFHGDPLKKQENLALL